MARDHGRDFTAGNDSDFLDRLIPLLEAAMQEVGPLAGGLEGDGETCADVARAARSL
jgi:hypothetical protein